MAELGKKLASAVASRPELAAIVLVAIVSNGMIAYSLESRLESLTEAIITLAGAC